MQAAIRQALSTSGNAVNEALADKVTVTSTGTGPGSSLEIQVSGLADTETFTLTESTANTTLGALGFSDLTVTAAAGSGGVFQIGANSTDTLSVEIAAIDASTLGVNALNLETDAAGAIDAIDTAIASVSTQRGELGAKQNRFESMINNLQVTTENLVASESRIRDTDMASEMTNFTKNQILAQAGTAMLAQANQVPQGVLSLLR
jgi:flagellin